MGAIGVAMLAGAVEALLTAGGPGPRTRHTAFFDIGGGYGGTWGLPGTIDVKDSGAFRFKAGYRTRPLGDGGGMALELALSTGFRGLGTGDNDKGGFGLSTVGGELRLYGRAREALQPYLQGGCLYYSLDDGRERDGVGVQGGGGVQIWAHRNLAVDINLVYDAVFFKRVEATPQGLTSTLGLKLYF